MSDPYGSFWGGFEHLSAQGQGEAAQGGQQANLSAAPGAHRDAHGFDGDGPFPGAAQFFANLDSHGAQREPDSLDMRLGTSGAGPASTSTGLPGLSSYGGAPSSSAQQQSSFDGLGVGGMNAANGRQDLSLSGGGQIGPLGANWHAASQGVWGSPEASNPVLGAGHGAFGSSLSSMQPHISHQPASMGLTQALDTSSESLSLHNRHGAGLSTSHAPPQKPPAAAPAPSAPGALPAASHAAPAGAPPGHMGAPGFPAATDAADAARARLARHALSILERSLGHLILVLDSTSTVIQVDGAPEDCVSMLGAPTQQVLGARLPTLVHVRDRAQVLQALKRWDREAGQGRQPSSLSRSVRFRTGRDGTQWLQGSYTWFSPAGAAQGPPSAGASLGMGLMLLRNITHEQQLLAAYRGWRWALQHTPLAFIEVRRDRSIKATAGQVHNILGTAPGLVKGRSLLDLFDPADQGTVASMLHLDGDGDAGGSERGPPGQAWLANVVEEGGARRPVHLRVHAQSLDQMIPIMGVEIWPSGPSLTHCARAGLLGALLELAPCYVQVLDAEHRVEATGARLLQALGLKAGEAAGSEPMASIHQDDRAELARRLDAAAASTSQLSTVPQALVLRRVSPQDPASALFWTLATIASARHPSGDFRSILLEVPVPEPAGLAAARDAGNTAAEAAALEAARSAASASAVQWATAGFASAVDACKRVWSDDGSAPTAMLDPPSHVSSGHGSAALHAAASPPAPPRAAPAQPPLAATESLTTTSAADEQPTGMEAGILAALSRVHKQVYLICTAAGRILWATGCTEDVLKYPLRELAGRSWHSLLHPDDIPRLVQLFGKALGSRLVGDEGAGDPSRSVVRLRQLPVQVVKKDGTSMSVELCMALVHEVWEHGAERHGPPLLLIHLHSRPPYAADLQKGRTAQRLSSIAWPLPRVACFQLTPDGRFAEPSPALGALLGKTPEELDGATVDAAAHASSREGLRALVAAAMDAAPEGAAAGEGGGNSANGAQSAANADAWAWLRTTDGRRVHRVKVARLAGSEASDPTLHGCVLPATAETRGDMLGLASAALATALGGLQVSVVPLDAAWAVAPALAVGAVWPAGIAPGTHISALVHPEDWASLGPVALASCNTPPQVGHTAVDADAEPDGGALLPLATAPAAAGLYGAAAGDADAAPTPPATLRCTVTWRFRSSPSSDWRWVTCAIHHLAVAEGANQAALVLIIAPHAAAQPSSSIAVAPAQQAANGADASRLGTRSNQAWEAIIVQIRSLLSDLAGSETERLDDVSGGASVWQQRQRASAGGAPPNTQTQIPAAQAATPELASTEIGGLLERLVAMGAKTTDEALALMGGATPPGSDGGTNSVQLL